MLLCRVVTNLNYIEIYSSYLSFQVSHCNYHRSFPSGAFVCQQPAHLHLNHRAISWHCTAKLQQVVGAVIWDGQGGAIKGGGH